MKRLLWPVLCLLLAAVVAGASDYEIVVSDTRVLDYGGTYSISAYGATGDGETDDSAAIQAAIDAVEALGSGTVDFNGMTCLVASGLTVDPTNSSKEIALDLYGATVLVDTTLNGAVFTIGGNVTLMGGLITTEDSSLDWDSTVGVKLSDSYRSRVVDTQIRNMEKGVELTADGTGCVHNYVSPRMIYDCKYGVYMTQLGAGWTNDNTIANASVFYSASLNSVDCSDGAAIWAEPDGGASTIMENNLFEGLSLENGSAQADGLIADAIYGTFYMSQFIGCRVEGFDGAADTLSSINIQSAGEGNVFIGGSGLEIEKFRYKRQSGAYDGRRAHRMVGEFQNKVGGGPVLELHTRGSYDAQPVFDVLSAAYDTLFAVRGDGALQVEPRSAAPTAPEAGTIYYDSDDNKLKVYNGTIWEDLN